WYVELGRRSQETVIARVVEEAPVCRAVDERAPEAQLFHGARKFGRGRVRGQHRQCGETREAVGPTGDGCGKMIVQLAAHRGTLGTRNQMGAGAGVGENLYRNARLIHRLQALLANLGKELKGVGAAGGQCSLAESAAADSRRIDAAGQRRNRKMLLDSDG